MTTRKPTHRPPRRRLIYVIVPRRGKPGRMLLDPARQPVDTTTRDLAKARKYAGRNGAHKFLERHPELRPTHKYQSIMS
jgi:hypothetical protein